MLLLFVVIISECSPITTRAAHTLHITAFTLACHGNVNVPFNRLNNFTASLFVWIHLKDTNDSTINKHTP